MWLEVVGSGVHGPKDDRGRDFWNISADLRRTPPHNTINDRPGPSPSSLYLVGTHGHVSKPCLITFQRLHFRVMLLVM